ncbi:cytochrome P450 [Ascodesmis nigricans]|uniref:Cytochrome P450 n=1 Tax=Ascodesmis nigricans TaxID=341454 RepID=A0A4S2MS17_9PEZI|nr:cytochrome P450 [Ascodesmis nigricans]
MVLVDKLTSFAIILLGVVLNLSVGEVMCAFLTALLTFFLLHITHNLFFHPLSHIPGPRLAAATHLYLTYHHFHGRLPFVLKLLHSHYGPVLRIAPNTLNFSSGTSLADIYGSSPHRKFFRKAPFYTNFDAGGNTNLNTETDVLKHRELKRLLGPSLSHRSVMGVEATVRRYVEVLVGGCGRLGAEEEGVEVTEVYTEFAFDLVADLVFGRRFESLETGKRHFWIKMLLENVRFMILLNALNKLFGISLRRIAATLPKFLLRDYYKTINFTTEVTQERITALSTPSPTPPRADLLTALLPSLLTASFPLPRVADNVQALVIGGTDTLSLFFSACTYFLCQYPSTQSRLLAELRAEFKSAVEITGERLEGEGCRYLNAVIRETMRVLPPVALPLPRVSPGETVDGVWVPEGTEVSTSFYAAATDDGHFKDPMRFEPLRWLDPETTDMLEASQPLLLGPRHLTYLEMRLAIARLVWEYEMQLVDRQRDWVNENRLYAFWLKAELRVRFKRRGAVGV